MERARAEDGSKGVPEARRLNLGTTEVEEAGDFQVVGGENEIYQRLPGHWAW